MLKKVVSTMLVTGVLTAAIVAPVFAASDVRPSPDKPMTSDKIGPNVSQSIPQTVLSTNSELSANKAKSNLFYEESSSKPGMGYFIFDADQWTGGHLFVSDAIRADSVHGAN